MPDLRTTCRGHSTYRTRRNTWRKVRTPGNRLSTLRLRTKPNPRVCGLTGETLNGLSRIPSYQCKPAERKVSRAYGGMLSMKATQEKILRAFLCEESRAAKLNAKAQQKKAAEKKAQKK